MALKPVTDEAVLSQLAGRKPVSDPALLEQLNGSAKKRSLTEQIFGTKESWTDPEAWKRVLGSTGRIVTDAAMSIPLAAADAGIAARNMITGENYGSATDLYKSAAETAGLPAPQTGVEKGVNLVGQMLVGSKIPAPQAGTQAPASFNPKAMRQLALEKARDAGYVVPPSTTNPTVLNRFLESWAGKTATAQDASIRNQPITDALVKKDLGLRVGDDVGAGTLPFLRQEAANAGYKPVRSFGTIRLDGKYSEKLDEIAAPYLKSEKAFPGLNKNDVTATIESLKQKAVDTDTAIDSIAILRDKANTAFRQGDSGIGNAYKSMAKELEGAIERSLSRRGEDSKKLLEQFRNARQLIAKTHSAEDALNPELGVFDARSFGRQLDQGKPLSGGMKKAGQAAQAFKEATKLISDSGSVRNTDVILGGGAAALSGNPLPLLYPFSRMAVRDFLLSKTGQGLLTSPSARYGASPELLMGGTAGLLGP